MGGSSRPSGSTKQKDPFTVTSSSSKRGEEEALSKEHVRKCLLRYVDNILCLDDIQGVVSLHQLGLLPREEMNSYLEGNDRNGNGMMKTRGTKGDEVEIGGWDLLEGMLSGEAGGIGGVGGIGPFSSFPYTGLGTHLAHHAPMSGLPPSMRSSLSSLSSLPPLSPVDVNARNAEGETALTFALKNEQLEMIKILVEKGKADINSQNADGNTELMMAARRGQTKMVKLLVETMGANVHLRNKEGMTALMVAEKYERTEIVRFLRNATSSGETILKKTILKKPRQVGGLKGGKK